MRKVLDMHFAISSRTMKHGQPLLAIEVMREYAGIEQWSVLALYENKVALLRDLVSASVTRAMAADLHFDESAYLAEVDRITDLYLAAIYELGWTGA
ncbi:DUF5405 family protein [Edwardsiella piscicida]|uniref:DUF5405 family protein n=1 Tax=Edwardsiella piscicida TaxID=1263550 RepID=UPI0002C0C3F5|nr:DUF5405 family protein [Edwardsiella piscicida]AGH72546.1 hypothetical protein ETAC_02065 [Edwardsiella piscicida C07-087]EKS7779989.1 DUF5405 family protein [Edwardsiella piscicida]